LERDVSLRATITDLIADNKAWTGSIWRAAVSWTGARCFFREREVFPEDSPGNQGS